MRTFATVVLLSVAGTAAADDLAPAPTEAPGFVTMLRQDSVSRVGGELSYYVLDGSDITLLRFDLHGHYVHPESGAGVYAQVPITFIGDTNDSDTALGGVEVGGLYIPQLASEQVGLVLRAGVVLPTAEKGAAAVAGLLATFLRPTDIFTQLPDTASSIRLSASPIVRSGKFFARMDGGLDINVYNDGGNTVDPGILLNFGAGADLGNVALMGEVTTLVITGDGGESISAAALSMRGNAGPVQPYAALLLPLDEEASDTFDLALLAGIEGRL